MLCWFKLYKLVINLIMKEQCFCISCGDMFEYINKGRVIYVLKCLLFYNNFEKFYFMDIFRNCLESINNDGFFFVYGIGIEVYLLMFGMKIIFKYRDF